MSTAAGQSHPRDDLEQAPNAPETVPSTNSQAPVTWKAFAVCIFASFGGILFGYDSGYINGVLGMPQFKIDFGHGGWVNTPEAYNGFFWLPGRQKTISLGCLIYCVGVILQVAAQSMNLLIVGRAIAGVGVGFVSATVILYVSKISPSQYRGILVGSYQFAITLGLLLSANVNFGTKNLQNPGAYRIPIALQFLWALILGVGLLFMPESPRWLLMKEKRSEARASLAEIRDQPENSNVVETEYLELQKSCTIAMQNKTEGNGYTNCFRGGFNGGSNLHLLAIGCALQMFQQLTGVNFIFYFGTTFFETIGIGDPFRIQCILTAVNALATPLAFYPIEKLGRRFLLIYGALGMCICQFIVAIVCVTTGRESNTAHVVLVIFICIYIAFFASTWGPVACAVTRELYPLPIRAKAVSLCTASNWLWNLIIAFITPYIVDTDKGNLGGKVFFIFGGTCFFGLLFTYFYIYETKGLIFEKISLMTKAFSARKSSRWVTMQRGVDSSGTEAREQDISAREEKEVTFQQRLSGNTRDSASS